MHVENLRRILVLGVCLVFGTVLHTSSTTRAQSSGAPGGFLESATSPTVRPQLTASQIAQFLPARGRFYFPAPYGTEAARLTNAGDCGGADCVNSVGYSFWRNINNHAGSNTMLIVITPDKHRGGAGPSLFSYDKVTGATQNVGPLFAATSPFSYHHGESWYFSATQPHTLYVNDGPRLLRYDVINRSFSTVFDASTQFGANRYIWSMHSSDNDAMHSFTLRDTNTYEMLGCAVYHEPDRRFLFFAKIGDFDECQIDKGGRYLMIKDNIDGVAGEDNVLEDLQTGTRRILLDQDGAAGHSDNGQGYFVAEDNWHSQPGAVRVFRFDLERHRPGPRTARQRWCRLGRVESHHAWQRPARHSDLRSIRVSQRRGSLCPAERAALLPARRFVAGAGSGADDDRHERERRRQHLFQAAESEPRRHRRVHGVVEQHGRQSQRRVHRSRTETPARPRIDSHAHANADPHAHSDTDTPPTPSGTAVIWNSLVNVSVGAIGMTKTSGCDGCQDAGAASTQILTSGDGYVEFVASEQQGLRDLGLSTGNSGTTESEIKHALRLDAGKIEVRESGVYKSDTPFVTGDLLRIAVNGGAVKYSKNGAVFYTSQVAPVYPLLVDVSMSSMSSTLNQAMVSFTTTSSPTPPPARLPHLHLRRHRRPWRRSGLAS